MSYETMVFSDVVEALKNLSPDEKQEIQLLLKQLIREERREIIYDNFKSAQLEQEKGELSFFSDLNCLKRFVEE